MNNLAFKTGDHIVFSNNKQGQIISVRYDTNELLLISDDEFTVYQGSFSDIIKVNGNTIIVS